MSRLHGSYERLWAGQVSEALVDLTGGLAECRGLGSGGGGGPEAEEQGGTASRDSDRGRRRRLSLNQLQAVRDGCALSCSTHSTPAGQSVSQEKGRFIYSLVDRKRLACGTFPSSSPWS